MKQADSAWLLKYRADVYSQKGEDGVIEKVLDTLPELDQWCVEFGAWDGMHLSNTRSLIENHNYSAVLIEANGRKYEDLKRNYAEKKNVFPVNAFVGFDQSDGLDAILRGTPIPLDFDFLSIDIDGNDYHAWEAVQEYAPKVVCIEFNPTIHTDVDYVQPADPRINSGSSLSALVRLGREKNYELVCVLPFNAIFVRKNYFHLFNIRDNSAYALRRDVSAVTHIFSGFDGKIMLAGCRRLPGHAIPLREKRMQQLPRMLRYYPGKYNLIQRLVFKIYRKLIS